MQVPNGLSFYLPELKWSAPRGASFNTIVQALNAVIKANPYLAQKNKWPTDVRAIEEWVDMYNAAVCARMGWDNYISSSEGGSLPKGAAPHRLQTLRSLKDAAARAKELVQGAKTLIEWDDSGEPPVDPELALKRAQTCAKCALNSAEDLTKWFTVPAAEMIRRRVEKFQKRNLTTPQDDNLNLCTACHCPLKLKVHIPIEWVVKRLTPDQVYKLRAGNGCWVIAEGNL